MSVSREPMAISRGRVMWVNMWVASTEDTRKRFAESLPACHSDNHSHAVN